MSYAHFMHLGTPQSDGVKQYGSVWASYNCPPCGQTIVSMQTALMQLAARLGTPSAMVKADGLVGAATVAALKAVADRVKTLAWGRDLANYNTAEKIAKNAGVILVFLQAGLQPNALPAAVVTPAPKPDVSNAPNIPMVSTDANAFAPAPPRRAGIRKEYLIGGGILAIGVIIAGVILLSPKHEYED